VASELVHRWETSLVNFAVAPRGKREEHKNMMLQTANHWTERLNLELTGTLSRREPSMPPQDDTQ